MTTEAVTHQDNDRPRHIAIIMDGNGRWAKKRHMPRFMGHRKGVEIVRDVVKSCLKAEIKVLTLFAFSSENWRRPQKEVSMLMDLFISSLKAEVAELNQNNVCLRFIGDCSQFTDKLNAHIATAEKTTTDNDGLILNIAVNYGGRWDITQACQNIAGQVAAGHITVDDIDDDLISSSLSLNGQPEPDLFIRTGGEKRISNFLLWQLAYTELYFTDILWPDFTDEAFQKALQSYASRQRRFGQTGDQMKAEKNA